MRGMWTIAGAAMLVAGGAAAASTTVRPAVFVERAEGDIRTLEPARELRRGDRVVLVMEWRGGRRGDATLVSRVPADLQFQRSGQRGVEVSVDGGRSWGHLGVLRKGDRLAAPEDVTDLRWRIDARRPAGVVSYRAIVR